MILIINIDFIQVYTSYTIQVYIHKTWYKTFIVYIGEQYINQSIGVAWNVGPYTLIWLQGILTLT